MKTREFATCFLFTKHLDADGCLSIRFNADGEEDAPLKKRNASEILDLQVEAKTIVVLPSILASLHRLALPWLGERKSREAIPFALEETVAQPFSEVHFAFDKAHYVDGQYLIVAIDTQRLSTVIGLLEELGLDFDAMTLDWFALHTNEVLVAQDYVLLSLTDFKGTLSPVLAQRHLIQENQRLIGHRFDDSAIEVQSAALTSISGLFDSFVAQRLLSRPFINLCQGDFRHYTDRETHSRWYSVCGTLLFVWFLSILGTNALMLHRLKTEEAGIHQQIMTVYQAFFPNASANEEHPRLKVEQFLREEESGRKGDVWYILGPLVKSIEQIDGVDVKQWVYQNRMITLNILAKNFMTLEQFENSLKKQNIIVKQTHAAAAEKGLVTATLELHS